MSRFFAGAALVAGAALAAVPADKVTNLPTFGAPLSDTYSGYLDAGKGKHLHYLFTASLNAPSTDPVVLWFNGGESRLIACPAGPPALQRLPSREPRPPSRPRRRPPLTRSLRLLLAALRLAASPRAQARAAPRSRAACPSPACTASRSSRRRRRWA